MIQYRIRYNKTANIVVALIVPPLAIMAAFVCLAISVDNIPEWAFYVTIFSALAIAILVAVLLVKKMSPAGLVMLTAEGFRVDFLNKNILTPDSFEIKTNEITNFYTDENNGNYYMAFATSARPGKFNLSAASKKQEDTESFAELMDAITKMTDENKTPGASPIAHITMYERTWAKLLVAAVLAIFFVAVISKLVKPSHEGPSWLRIFVLLLIGFPFIYKVYYHNYVKKKDQKI